MAQKLRRWSGTQWGVPDKEARPPLGYSVLAVPALVLVLSIIAMGDALDRVLALTLGCVLLAMIWLVHHGESENSARAARSAARAEWTAAGMFAAFCYGALLVSMSVREVRQGDDAAEAVVLAVLLLCCLLTPFVLWRSPAILASYLVGQQFAMGAGALIGAPVTIALIWPFVASQGCILVLALLQVDKLGRRLNVSLRARDSLQSSQDAMVKHQAVLERSRSEFLATACHDLRQPANALALFIDELDYAAPGPEFDHVVHRVRSASSNLIASLDVLTEIALADAGRSTLKRETVNIAQVAETVCATFRVSAEAKGLKLEVGTVAEFALGDGAILHSILANLVSNAIKYTDSGWVRISTAARGTQVDVLVEDSGRGIAEADQARLFEEFFRGTNVGPRETGMGLGLALVKRLVRRADLQISLTSKVGEGSCFKLTMPRALASFASPPTASSTQVRDPGNALDGRCVLVVEDDIFVASSMKRAVERWGAVVDEAHDLKQMQTLLKRSTRLPDVVIVDYRLAEDGSGFDAIRILREHRATSGIPILMVTGDLDEAVRIRAKQHGVRLMHKPLSVASLNRTLLELLSPQSNMDAQEPEAHRRHAGAVPHERSSR